MGRMGNVLTAYVFAMLGMFLAFAPWSPVWEAATRVLGPSAWGSLAGAGWVRGAISGLGALNLLVALQEAAQLRRTAGPAAGDRR